MLTFPDVWLPPGIKYVAEADGNWQVGAGMRGGRGLRQNWNFPHRVESKGELAHGGEVIFQLMYYAIHTEHYLEKNLQVLARVQLFGGGGKNEKA